MESRVALADLTWGIAEIIGVSSFFAEKRTDTDNPARLRGRGLMRVLPDDERIAQDQGDLRPALEPMECQPLLGQDMRQVSRAKRSSEETSRAASASGNPSPANATRRPLEMPSRTTAALSTPRLGEK